MDYSNYLNKDYKSSSIERGRSKPRIRRRHLHILAISSVIVGFIALINPSHQAEATRQVTQSNTIPTTPDSQLSSLLNLPLDLPGQHSIEKPLPVASQVKESPWQEIEVKAGDSLSLIFDRLQLSPQQLHTLLEADKEEHYLRRLRPKQTLSFQIADNEIQALQQTQCDKELPHQPRR